MCLTCHICHKEFLSIAPTTPCSSNHKCEICPNSKTFVNAHALKIHTSGCHKEYFVNLSPVEECNRCQERIVNSKSNVPVLKRIPIPKGARISVANKLSSVINRSMLVLTSIQ
jgi:hypothetical protein